MKTVILAGGRGTRLSEYTGLIPKPMVEIGEQPILWHLMQFYARQGFSDFVVALGYKGQIIKDYFLNYRLRNSNLVIELHKGKASAISPPDTDWRISLIDTGQKTMTGGRIKKIKEYIGNETFMMTYGDGLSNVSIKDLLAFHKSHGKLVTVTAVHPIARFGEIDFESSGKVKSFQEKPQTKTGWINGGFFVIEPEFLDLISDEDVMLEQQPLERAVEMGELMAYQHEGFWYCMDTVRDREALEEMWLSGDAPWTLNDR